MPVSTVVAGLKPTSRTRSATSASVEGTSPGYVPPHLTREDDDEARAVDEEEARRMARRLAKEEGILQLARGLGPRHQVATVAVDTGLKYLAGDLFSDDRS